MDRRPYARSLLPRHRTWLFGMGICDGRQRRQKRGADDRRKSPCQKAMCGVAEEDFVRMDADPFSTQAPCDVTANGRGEHGDDNQIDTGANLECAGRYARTAPRRYGREAHASTKRKENQGQSGRLSL